MFELLQRVESLGVWGLVQTLIQLIAALIGVRLVFFPRRRIKQLDFWAEVRTDHPQFPRAATLRVQNYTGTSIVISHPYFRTSELRAHPSGASNAATDEMQLKFPESSGQYLTEVELLLRNKESTYTLIPFDNTESEDRVRSAVTRRETGTIECNVTWLTRRPRTDRLRVRI